MGYRIKERPLPPKPKRSTDATITPSEHYITNGTKKVFAFPCFYQEVTPPVHAHLHDKHWHDHIGWPSPNHPDHICQVGAPMPYDAKFAAKHHLAPFDFYLDPKNLVPIHFREEGYTSFLDAWREDTHPTMTIALDEKDDWIVKASVTASMNDAIEEPQEYHFSIFGVTSDNERKDLIVLGKMIVLPASI